MDADELGGRRCATAGTCSRARSAVDREAYVSLGFILTSQGRPKRAIPVLRQAIGIEPDNVHAHWNLATAALLAGDLALGFHEYEWRKRHDLFRRDFINLPGPIWTGDDPSGRVIMVHAEQGLGDTIQFARYLPLIARAGGEPVLACEPSLIPLLNGIEGARVVSKFDPLPRYDAWIDQMSLPRAFATTIDVRSVPCRLSRGRSGNPRRPPLWPIPCPPDRPRLGRQSIAPQRPPPHAAGGSVRAVFGPPIAWHCRIAA